MVVLAFAAVYLIWGSTFLAIRVAVGSIPPLLMMGLRCVVAGGLLLLAAAIQRHRVTWRNWLDAAIAGALMFGVAYGALAWSELRINSGTAALLVATLPFWMALLDWSRRRVRPGGRVLAGLAIGLGGVALLVARGSGGPIAPAPVLAIVAGELAWAAGSVYAAPRLPQPITLNAGMPLLTGGVLLLAMASASGEARSFAPLAVSHASMAALAYLIVFGSIVAFSAYAWLLSVAPASQVATHAYVNPVVAVALGAMIGGEPLTGAIATAASVIAVGVALVLSGEFRRTSPERAPAPPRPPLILEGESA